MLYTCSKMKISIVFLLLVLFTTVNSYSLNRETEHLKNYDTLLSNSQDFSGNLHTVKEKRSISSIWHKIVAACHNLEAGVKETTLKVLKEYQPQIISALENVERVVIKAATELVIEVSKTVIKIIVNGTCVTSDQSPCPSNDFTGIYVELDDIVPRINVFSDVWKKVKTAVSNFGDKVQNTTNILIEKYKPTIEQALQSVKRVVIIEGKKIVIEIVGDIVKVIIDGITQTSEASSLVVKRSISDWWTKIKSAASNLGDNVRNTTMKVLKEYRPKIINAINNVKKVVIDGVKQVIIKVCGDIIKIISGGESATSNNNTCPTNLKAEDIYVVIDNPSIVAYSFSDIWSKVKKAVKNAGDKIEDTYQKLVEKYKPKIIEALNNVQKVVIDQGKVIIFEIVGDIVRVIVDGKTSSSNE